MDEVERPMNDWQRAKAFVPRCGRCESWREMALGDRCPSCDSLILQRYEELRGMALEAEKSANLVVLDTSV